MQLLLIKGGLLIGDRLSGYVTELIHDPLNIEYHGDIPEVRALFKEAPYIIENIRRIRSDANLLTGASTIDEYGHCFIANGKLEWFSDKSLGWYLPSPGNEVDYQSEYKGISKVIRDVSTFNDYWYKQPLSFSGLKIAKKNIRSVKDFGNLSASLWQGLKSAIDSNSKDWFIADLLQNYIYACYAYELSKLGNLLLKLEKTNPDYFYQIFSESTISGELGIIEFLSQFQVTNVDYFVKIPDELLIQAIDKEDNYSVVETIYLTKRILESDLFSLVQDIAGEVDFT